MIMSRSTLRQIVSLALVETVTIALASTYAKRDEPIPAKVRLSMDALTHYRSQAWVMAVGVMPKEKIPMSFSDYAKYERAILGAQSVVKQNYVGRMPTASWLSAVLAVLEDHLPSLPPKPEGRRIVWERMVDVLFQLYRMIDPDLSEDDHMTHGLEVANAIRALV